MSEGGEGFISTGTPTIREWKDYRFPMEEKWIKSFINLSPFPVAQTEKDKES